LKDWGSRKKLLVELDFLSTKAYITSTWELRMSTTEPNYEAEYEAFHQNMMDLQHYETILKEMLLEMKEDLNDCEIFPGNKAITKYWMLTLIEKLPEDEYWKEWLEKNMKEKKSE
jgi:hypothetical protein